MHPNMASVDSHRRPRALLVPHPTVGHWNPMKIFMRLLVEYKISFTVLTSQSRVRELQECKRKGEFDGIEDPEFVDIFSETKTEEVSLPAVIVKRLQEEFWGHPSLKNELVAKKNSRRGPTFAVADMFQYWTQDIADELGIPRYILYTSPVTFTLVLLHSPAMIDEKWELRSRDRAKREQVLDSYVGLEQFQVGDLPPSMNLFPDYYRLYSKSVSRAAGHIFNSFLPYEAELADAFHRQLETVAATSNRNRVSTTFFIGPMMYLAPEPAPAVNNTESISKTLQEQSDCLSFLDTQPAKSVLYICFGSQPEFTQSSITELARGLELCGVSFLWILPHPNLRGSEVRPLWDPTEVLPSGFLSATKGWGLVWTGWAPQKEILKHSSVGGFVSHCGWNSQVESMLEGVPMVAWPLSSDQFLNARFMTSAKVGVQIKDNEEGAYVAEEIAKAIQVLMRSEDGKQHRLKMQELRRTILEALEEDGSSRRAIRAFVKEVTEQNCSSS